MTVYHHVLFGSFPGESWSMSIHSQKVGGVLTDAATAFVTACGVLWTTGDTTGIRPDIASTVASTECSTAELDPLTGHQLGRIVTAFAHPGTSASASLPPQLSVVGSMRTALATRAGRGRFYLPPMAANVNSAGRVDGTVLTHIVNTLQDFLQSMATSLYPPVIYHRASKTYTDVVSVDVGDVFDTQRRRRNKLIETRTSAVL